MGVYPLQADVALVIPSEMLLPVLTPRSPELEAELTLFEEATGPIEPDEPVDRIDMLTWLARRVESLGVGLVVPLAPRLPAPRWAVEALLALAWGVENPAYLPRRGKGPEAAPPWAVRIGDFATRVALDPTLRNVRHIVHIDPAYARPHRAAVAEEAAAARGVGLTTHIGSLAVLTANDVDALVASLTAAAAAIDPSRVQPSEWPEHDDDAPF